MSPARSRTRTAQSGDKRTNHEATAPPTNKFKYNLRDKLDISEIIDIFTCEENVSF